MKTCFFFCCENVFFGKNIFLEKCAFWYKCFCFVLLKTFFYILLYDPYSAETGFLTKHSECDLLVMAYSVWFLLLDRQTSLSLEYSIYSIQYTVYTVYIFMPYSVCFVLPGRQSSISIHSVALQGQGKMGYRFSTRLNSHIFDEVYFLILEKNHTIWLIKKKLLCFTCIETLICVIFVQIFKTIFF